MLTERLDQHRGRGQQQIVVKHVTVNADQAVVTDTVVTGKPAGNAEPSPALLSNAAEKAMPRLDETRKLEPVGDMKKRNEHQPHAQGPRRSPMHGQIKADGKPMSRACWCKAVGFAGCMAPVVAPRRANGMGITGTAPARRKHRALEAHQIASLMSLSGVKRTSAFCAAHVCF